MVETEELTFREIVLSSDLKSLRVLAENFKSPAPWTQKLWSMSIAQNLTQKQQNRWRHPSNPQMKPKFLQHLTRLWFFLASFVPKIAKILAKQSQHANPLNPKHSTFPTGSKALTNRNKTAQPFSLDKHLVCPWTFQQGAHRVFQKFTKQINYFPKGKKRNSQRESTKSQP